MARYKLYCVGASGNSYKVALYLNCAGLDWQPVGVDFAGGQMRDAGWRAESNAMGEIPVLEVDGQLIVTIGSPAPYSRASALVRQNGPTRCCRHHPIEPDSPSPAIAPERQTNAIPD